MRDRSWMHARGARSAALAAGAALIAALAVPAQTEAQGIRYGIGGAANHIQWDDELGLDNGRLFGVRGSIDFGPVVGLRAHYLWGSDFDTRFGDITIIDDGPALEEQSVDVNSIGADIVFNLLSGSVIPYALAGGGVLRFDPATGNRFDQVYGRLGAGLGFELSRALRGDVWVANTRMRLNRFNLAAPVDGGFPDDPQADDLRSNWTYGAGLALDLGGPVSPVMAQRWSAVSFPVELFAGRLSHDRGNIGDQNLVGARAGVDFRYVGLRGFYWRGLNDDWDGTNRVQSYGGEAQFNLHAGRGVAPFLVLGAGRLDYREGFLDDVGETPGDEEFLIGGAGLAIRLTDAFTINLAARDYIFSTVDPEDVSGTDELTHNWLFTAGVGFNIGRDRSDPTLAEAPSAEERVAQAERDRQEQEQERSADAAERDRTRTVADDERVLQVPVPERGEIYIRYGEGARMEVLREGRSPEGALRGMDRLTDEDLDRLAEAIASELNGEQQDRTTRGAREDVAPMRAERLRGIVRDELERLNLGERGAAQQPQAGFRAEDERLREVVREELERMGIRQQLEEISRTLRERAAQDAERGRTETVVVTPEEEPRTGTIEVEARQPGTLGVLSNPVAYMAFAMDDPAHIAFGGRVEAGRLSGMESLAVVPELALGFVNNGTSFLAAGNLEYTFGALRIGDSFRIQPVVRPGIGLLSVPDEGTEGVLNLTYGFTSGFGDSPNGLRWFVEHQGLDLFDRSRLSAGVRWTR